MKLNSKFTWAFFPIIFLAVCCGSSCSKADKQQLVLIDSLQMLVDETGKALDIDTGVLAARKRLIDDNMRVIRMQYTEQFTPEFARAMDLYRGIFKIYRSMLDHYPEMKEEQEALEKQLRDLSYSLKKGSVSAADFQKYYPAERSDVLAHSKQVNLYVAPVHEVEPMYKNLSKQVEEAVKRAVAKAD